MGFGCLHFGVGASEKSELRHDWKNQSLRLDNDADIPILLASSLQNLKSRLIVVLGTLGMSGISALNPES